MALFELWRDINAGLSAFGVGMICAMRNLGLRFEKYLEIMNLENQLLPDSLRFQLDEWASVGLL